MKQWWAQEKAEGGDVMLGVMVLAVAFAAVLSFGLDAIAQTPTAQLTREEQLDQRVFQLELALETATKETNDCRGALGPYRASVRGQELASEELALKARIDRAHPGFSYDPRTGQFTKVEEAK